ncbi:MAG TPA: SpoIIE family protein phosphatase [Candidatus Acidoferrales bacterium]|jgi:sigma-B regulation protein RsbU (phosphoserine phosphatase)|nr:SpoIIE family protein phosphatase [Candidatus Acidoferrales bacterium]
MLTMALESTRELAATQPRVLIADDQPDVLEALRLLLKGHGYMTEAVTSPAALFDAMTQKEFDLILMDLNYARDTTSGREGLDLLARLKAAENAPPIVVMTGWATVGLAVEAMQQGIGDFVEKPWVNSRLLDILQKQVQIGRDRREARQQAIAFTRAQERESAEARSIQQGFLPKEIPQLAGYEIVGAWQPARVVGGDYYDVLPFGKETLGLCIGDVAGKGLPAALLMSNLQAAFRGFASPAVSPEALCDKLNSLICRNIASDRFITFFYAQLDGVARQLRYTNAGHNAPIVAHKDGSHDRLREGGGILGVFPVQAFDMGVYDLAAGDRVLLFTDGVTEACNPEGEEFGDARLLQLLEENRELSAEDLQRKILSVVAEFCRGHWLDDATLIAIAVA